MTRLRAIKVFRDLLREAKCMPTDNRTTFIEKQVRLNFRENRALGGQEKEEAIQLAELQLENVRAQHLHLQELRRRGYLKS